MPGHDQLFKELLRVFFTQFMMLVAPAIAVRLRLDQAAFSDKEVFTDLSLGAQNEADIFAIVPLDIARPTRAGVHCEIEARARSSMSRRLWRYNLQLQLRHDVPVLSVVIYLKGGPGGLSLQEYPVRVADQRVSLFTYMALGLAGCDAEAYLARPEPVAWALAALMKRGKMSRARHKLACLKPIAACSLDGARKFLLANFVESYISLRGRDADEYDQLLRLEGNEEVAVMEMTWAEQLEAKGEARGEARGIRRSVIRLLERRFGPVPQTLQQQVETTTSLEALNELLDRAAVARSLDELSEHR